jgi:uracil-DNA glycosylase family 4
VNIKNIQKVLLECYSKDLCYPKVQCDWNENNRCFGMCAITSLIINDYFGGDICKIYVDGISHYFNLIENNIVDLTKDQFNREMDYKDYKIMDREKILTDDTKNRYITLKARLINKLLRQVDKKVYSCKSCDKLVDKFPDDVTVFLGKDNDIVLVGEAPANNGWRKSHKLWIDLNGKVLPSGLVLQKLFDIIDRNIFETTFLESVKCYPLERKNLKTCSSNCKNIMLEQLKILNPKLIITLGEFPTRNLLDFKFNKFADVVGKIYEVNDYKILPIYHPSPISPKSYTGNIPIFEKLRDM